GPPAAPFARGRDDASLSGPEPAVAPAANTPMLVPLDGSAPLPLVENPLVIGRDADCDVRINSPQISGKHCELRSDGLVWWVVDLGSKNGTQVNGSPITEQILKPGDRLSLSRQHHFRVDYPADPRAVPEGVARWVLLVLGSATAAATGLYLWRIFG